MITIIGMYIKKYLRIWNIHVDNFLHFLFLLLLFFIPFQLSKHFFSDQAIVYGKLIDYYLPFIYLIDIIIILYVSITLYSLVFIKRKVNHFQSMILLLIFLVFLFLNNYEFIKDLSFILKYIRFIEGILLTISLGINYEKGFDWLKIFKVSLISTLIVSIIIIGQFILQRSLGFWMLGEWYYTSSTLGLASFYIFETKLMRPRGTFPHPNIAAYYLATFSLPILHQFIEQKKYRFLLIYLLNFTAVFLCMSRVGILLFILNFLIYVYYLLSIKKMYKTILKNKILVKIGASIVFFSVVFLPSISFRFISLFQEDYLSIERRLFLSNEAQRIIGENFFFGVGLNNFIKFIDIEKLYLLSFFFQPVHNYFLLFISENGVILFLLFLSVILFGFLVQIQYFYEEKTFYRLFLLSFFISFFIVSFVDHYFYSLEQGFILLFLFISFSLFSTKPKT